MAVPTRFLAPRDSFPEYNAVTVGNSGAIWTGTGGLTISRSQHTFRTAYLRFILIEHRYSLHSDHYTRATRMNQCFVLFAGSVHSMCNDAQSRLEYIIYGSQTELAGCDEWQSRIRMEQSVDAMSLKHVQLVFPFFFFFVLCLSYNFKWQTVSNLFIFLCCTFHCVNSKMLN